MNNLGTFGSRCQLYQQMLEEAVAEARGMVSDTISDDDWSPQISVGLPVLIPEKCTRLSVRMGLYRRLAHLKTREEIDIFGVELIDRFGPIQKRHLNNRVVILREM